MCDNGRVLLNLEFFTYSIINAVFYHNIYKRILWKWFTSNALWCYDVDFAMPYWILKQINFWNVPEGAKLGRYADVMLYIRCFLGKTELMINLLKTLNTLHICFP